MRNRMEAVCRMIKQMDGHLRRELLRDGGKGQEEKLWENTYIKAQIDRRRSGGIFSISDHIRAMVYAMLSSVNSWGRVAQEISPDTKCLVAVDRIFCGYDAERLLERTPEQLRDAVKEIRCGTVSTLKQMNALLSHNIPKLLEIEKEYGVIDRYYQKFIEIDHTLKTLIIALSAQDSQDKMVQMETALVCEYLRNIGYDLPKPERHICRILGRDYLALSEEQDVPPFEAFDLVVKLAEMMQKPAAEVDYILWLYCADKQGEVCTKKKPKCRICVANTVCQGAHRDSAS